MHIKVGGFTGLFHLDNALIKRLSLNRPVVFVFAYELIRCATYGLVGKKFVLNLPLTSGRALCNKTEATPVLHRCLGSFSHTRKIN